MGGELLAVLMVVAFMAMLLAGFPVALSLAVSAPFPFDCQTPAAEVKSAPVFTAISTSAMLTVTVTTLPRSSSIRVSSARATEFRPSEPPDSTV